MKPLKHVPDRSKTRRLFRRCAGIALVLLIAGISCNRVPSNKAYLTGIQGSVHLIDGEEKTELDAATIKEKPLLVVAGQYIETGPGSQAELRFRNGMIVRVGESSRYRYSKTALIGDLKTHRYRAIIQQGTVYFKSDQLPPGTEYILTSTTAVASIRGTEFIMSASEEFSEILVREGQVDVKALVGTQQAQVNPGEKALVDRFGNITVTKLTDGDGAKFDILTAKLGDRKIDESKEFASEDQIRAHYGTLFEVRLVDERVYNGYIVRNGNQVKIHTTYGVIELENEMIQSAKELKQ